MGLKIIDLPNCLEIYSDDIIPPLKRRGVSRSRAKFNSGQALIKNILIWGVFPLNFERFLKKWYMIRVNLCQKNPINLLLY